MRNPSVFLLFLLLPACLARHEPADGWQKVEVIRLDTESIAIHGLALNQQGVLLAAGYTEQSYDCGPLDAGVCKLYRLYRSFNGGSTWEEVSDSLIAYRHAFVKDDNLPNRVAGTNPIGRAIIIAKECTSSNESGQLRGKRKERIQRFWSC